MTEITARVINKLIGPVARSMRGMVLRGVITLVNDAAALQRHQVQLRAMPQPDGSVGVERADDVEVVGHYGLTSVPHAGAEVVMLSVGGVRAHGLIIAVDDRRYRLTGLQAGEVALYDDLGNSVKLGREALEVTGKTQVTVTAPVAQVFGQSVAIGAAGGAAIARVGDSVVDGKITTGSATVTCA